MGRPEEDPKALRRVLDLLMFAPNPGEIRRILEKHGDYLELLARALSDENLDKLAQMGNTETRQRLQKLGQIVIAAKERGIEAAFANVPAPKPMAPADLEKLLTWIDQQPEGQDLVDYGYHALQYIDPLKDPATWAHLQAKLGMSLARDKRLGPAINFERAILAYEAALEAGGLASAFSQAALYNNLGKALSQRAYGDPRENIESAIEAYRKALEGISPEEHPEPWCIFQDNLAEAYQLRQTGKPTENIDRAVECYQAVADLRAQQKKTPVWVGTMFKLGNACLSVARESGAHQERAIQAFQAALAPLASEQDRELKAIINLSLGMVHGWRIAGNRDENLDRARALFDAALKIAGSDFPEVRAAVQFEIGNLFTLGKADYPGKDLQKGIRAYQEALEVFTPSQHPQRYVAVAEKLADVYLQTTSGKDIDRAIALYQNMLKILEPQGPSEFWAQIHYRLGQAWFLCQTGDQLQNRLTSMKAVEKALAVFTAERHPALWGGCMVLTAKIFLEVGGQDISEAWVKTFERAVGVFDAERNRQETSVLQHILGRAYAARSPGKAGENQERAIQALEKALAAMGEGIPGDRDPVIRIELYELYSQRIQGDRNINQEVARKHLQAAIDRLDAEKWPALWAKTQLYLGNHFWTRTEGKRGENFRRAAVCYRNALTVYTRESHFLNWVDAGSNLGSALLASDGDPKKNRVEAIVVLERVLAAIAGDEYVDRRARCQFHLGLAYTQHHGEDRAEHQDRAIHHLQAAREVFETTGISLETVNIYLHLGMVWSSRIRGDRADNLEGALAVLEKGVEIAGTVDPAQLGDLYLQLGYVYWMRMKGDRTKNLEQARGVLQAAPDVFDRRRDPGKWAVGQLYLGFIYSDRILGERSANLERAIGALESALEVLTADQDPALWSQAQNSLGCVYWHRQRGERSDNLEKSIQAYDRALRVRSVEARPWEWAQTQNNLALSYQARIQGDAEENLAKAMEAYQSALRVWTRDQHPYDWALAHLNLGRLYVKQISARPAFLDKALHAFHATLTVYTSEFSPVYRAQCYVDIGEAYAAASREPHDDHASRAREAFQQGLAGMPLETTPHEHGIIQEKLGDLFFAQAAWSKSIEPYRQAFRAGNTVYRLAATPESKQKVMSGAHGLPQRLAYALAKEGHLEEAVLVLEQGRARFLSEALQLGALDIGNLGKAGRDAFIALRERIQNLQSQARLLESLPEQEPHVLTFDQSEAVDGDRIRKQLERTRHAEERAQRERFLDLTHQLKSAHKEMEAFLNRGLSRQTEPSLEEILDAARSKPLVYLLATPAGGLALTCRFQASPPAAALWLPELNDKALRNRLFGENQIGYIRAYLRNTGGEDAPLEPWLAALEQITSWLWETVTGPLIDSLGKDRKAAVVPFGFLGVLPLHAAWTYDERRPTGRNYAMDYLELSTVPNARALAYSQKVAAGLSSSSLLAVVDPQPTSGTPLPGAGLEVGSAIGSFKQHHVLAGEQASREALLKALAACDVAHFACHGFADLFQPLNSGLLLAEDVVLRVQDLLNLSLNPKRLAVLSACETSMPGMKLPDEVVSLSAGLLQSGFAGVVASLWPVSDLGTAMLMIRFYEFWLREKLSPEAALIAAQQWLRDTTNGEKADYFKTIMNGASGSHAESAETLYQVLVLENPDERAFAHPFHWAAFGFVGV